MKKRIIILSISFAVAIITSFLCGYFVGCNDCGKNRKKHFKVKDIKFFEVKKHVGEVMTKDEKNAIKFFVRNFEDCLEGALDENEKKELSVIKNEMLELAKYNKKISVNVKDLKSNDATNIVKKVRKCSNKSRKHMTKMDKRLLYKGISKMHIDEIINIFHGIK